MLSKYNVFRLAFVLMLMGSFVLQAKEEARHYIIIIEEDIKDSLPLIIETSGNVFCGTGERLELRATIKDDVGVASSKLYLLNIGEDRYIEKELEEKGDGVYTATITLPNNKVGELNYYLVAKDLEGNETRAPLDGTYKITVVDTEPPIIKPITLPLSSATGENVVVEAEFTDNIGIDTVTLRYTPIDGKETTLPFTLNGKRAKAHLKIAKDKVGIINYYITAKDKAGNITRIPKEPEVYKISVVDNIKPSVFLSPDNPSDVESGDVITIRGDFSDNISVTKASLIWNPVNAIAISSGWIDFMSKKADLKIRDGFIGTFKYLLEVEDKAGNKATTPPLEVKVSKRLPRGTLFVKSEPERARVFLEGRYKGETPLEIRNLRPWKPFELVLELKDFEIWKTKTFVEPEKTTEINARLQVEGGGAIFIVSSPPMAKVYIDREFVGTTPIRDIRIEAGKHNLKVVKEGYRPWTKELFLLNGQKVYLSFDLESGVYSEVVIK